MNRVSNADFEDGSEPAFFRQLEDDEGTEMVRESATSEADTELRRLTQMTKQTMGDNQSDTSFTRLNQDHDINKSQISSNSKGSASKQKAPRLG